MEQSFGTREHGKFMGRNVAIGLQNYNEIIKNNCFYIDKTKFIKEWWESRDKVTLITRPRRFGKTLTMSMTEQFFSVNYADRGDLFEGKDIWQEVQYRELQGTYPVISLSFANVKENNYADARERIEDIVKTEYIKNIFLLEGNVLTEEDKVYFKKVMRGDISDVMLTSSLHHLSDYLCRYYGKKVIILLDEYDTPMQEAYVNGFWNELVFFTRSLFNATFKTNPYLERAIMTGITRVSRESMFSDLNNLEVITTTSDKYADCFGFTEKEVFAAMDECGLPDKQLVKMWYDGFVFGNMRDIYNPWSIINYLNKGKVGVYWANTSSNALAGKLIRQADTGVKQTFEQLLKGEHLFASIDEQVVYDRLNGSSNAIWSLFVASGYLKVLSYETYEDVSERQRPMYELAVTNREVQCMFEELVLNWFSEAENDYNEFVRALLQCDVKAMNRYMNRVALQTFSYFDTGKQPSYSEPERFYHGFVLGLMVDLKNRYVITSNRESGFGRYDVMLEPLRQGDDAYILEFKVHDPEEEKNLKETVEAAQKQIEQKQYEIKLLAKGISSERIRKYGFAFEGKTVLIG